MNSGEVPAVAEVGANVRSVLARFRSGQTFPFSFGDGRPEAVMVSYDQFEDLDGETRFQRNPGVLGPDDLAQHLPAMVAAIRAESFLPVVWGERTAEAVVMSTAQYRDLRGDDQPPAGVDDDPTRRVYASEPLPDSRPMTVDELAAMMGPEAVEDLREARRADRDGS